MSKLIKKLAFVFMVTLLTAVTTNIAFAEEGSEPEKELALYNTDGDIDGDGIEDLWTGLRYMNDDGETCIEVSYNGKSLTSLAEKGYTVEMKAYEEYPSDIASSLWSNIDHKKIISNTDNDIFIIKYFTNYNNIYQFRILGLDGNLISMSDKFVINPDTTFPVMISSSPYNYDSYSLDGQSIKIMLKYNDNLVLENINENSYMTLSPLIPSDIPYLSKSYFATNLSYDNHSETVSIDGNNYIWNYSLVTFYCNFSNYQFDDMDNDYYTIPYKLTLKNLIGKNYNEEPCFIKYYVKSFKVKCPTLSRQFFDKVIVRC